MTFAGEKVDILVMLPITIITPHLPNVDRTWMLQELAGCLSAQSYSGPVSWRIVIDGGTDENVGELFDLLSPLLGENVSLYVSHTFGRVLGAGLVRNLALGETDTPLVSSVDDDDMIVADCLQRLCSVLVEREDLVWCGGLLQDWYPAEESSFGNVWRAPAGVGEFAPFEVMDCWGSSGGEFPMNTAGVVMRTVELKALGGWGGLPSGEDFAMIAKMTDAYPGMVCDMVSYLYRKYPNQSMVQPFYQRMEERIRESIWGEVQARRMLAGRI